MPKNLLIFSDGTGQAGGVRPDQRLSNVYKLYRATRTGPDSPIDPSRQIAFYDAGLGTDDDVKGGLTGIVRWLRKMLGSVTGRGITRNITDCYEAILNSYEPGDRIFLFGFSRGAYTARSVASVLALCGVPTTDSDGQPLPRRKRRTHVIADEAVRKVYEHGAGRPAAEFEAERDELARRFRSRYRSGDAEASNAAPYFIGVFDTVASLGAQGIRRLLLAGGLITGALIVCAAVAGAFHVITGTPFLACWAVLALAGSVAFTASSIRSTFHSIRDFPVQGRRSWHIAKWQMENYDRRLNRRVRFARHAIAIDETRADFPRVPWGFKNQTYARIAGEPEPFIQMWFAGNHSDIGGSYPEEESRLSDIALKWMVDEARSLPDPLVVDPSRLNMFPSAAGAQHCEVDSTRDTIASMLPGWWPSRWLPTWKEKPRTEVLNSILHESVIERFNLPLVEKCGRHTRYLPSTLRDDPRVAALYDEK